MNVVMEPVIGRYMHMELDGKKHRVYFEEAGSGIPLLCLHTAGSDGRQYRALLNDPRITDNYRVIVFDMPWHGKSSPPEGWHDIEYQLSSDNYINMVMAVSKALKLDKPVAIGCSIGGRIVLHLAKKHPEAFRALIGLQSGAHVDPYYDLNYLYQPDIHGEVSAAIVSGLIGPNVSDKDRWETLWHYMQGGPGIFKGDLYFYMTDGDLREEVATIDTSKCPLYFLTGEYDYSSTVEDTKALGKSIKGCSLQIMEGLGHFPMSEDYEIFSSYLLPVLGKIKAQ